MRSDKHGDTLAGGARFVDDYLAYLLAQASQRISAEFHQQVKAAGLSVTEWRVLASLEGSQGETIGDLAVLAITKQPTLSKVVQRMEAEGLVARTGVRADRRSLRSRRAGARPAVRADRESLLPHSHSPPSRSVNLNSFRTLSCRGRQIISFFLEPRLLFWGFWYILIYRI